MHKYNVECHCTEGMSELDTLLAEMIERAALNND